MHAVMSGADAGALHMQIQGQGETVVMLHGWGMHSGIWRELANALSARFRVVCIDLPGHGYSAALCPLTLQAVVRQILSQVPDGCHWLGWSLGASVVMNLKATDPERVRSMTLLSANPCFVRNEYWQHGIDAQVLSRFADDLQGDYRKTLKKFIALQTLSSDAARETLKQLREQLFSTTEPDAIALREGLDILMHADLRADVELNASPCLVLLGERDQLVPASIAEFYQALPCKPQVEVIAGAGHAPFLSHPRQTLEIIVPFIDAHAGNVPI